MIPVKVEKISYHPSSRSYAVILKDDSSKLFLPILVGSFEAQSIAIGIENDIKQKKTGSRVMMLLAIGFIAGFYTKKYLIK